MSNPTAWAARGLLALALTGPALAQLGPPPVPPQNPITEAKRVLGKALFWDEQLSSDSTIACGTCHIPGLGGADPRVGNQAVHPGLDDLLGTPDDKFGSLGIRNFDSAHSFREDATFGFEPQVTTRLANSMIGAAHATTLFWDGRAGSTFIDPETGNVSIPNGGALESQALVPILSPVEMGHEGRTWEQVTTKLERVRPLALAWNLTGDLATAVAGGTSYPDLFADAFGDPAITAERIAYAIATYERTLNPDQTAFDAFAAGNQNALTQEERNGLNAFNSPQSRCNACHAGPNFSDNSFRNLGTRPIAEDNGRQGVTGNFGDRGHFKVPSLRNVTLRERFFHNGQFTSLQQIMQFYDQDGGPFNDNKDPLLNNLSVPPQPGNNIIAFLSSLTDPRVAEGLPPFDRPSLNSERSQPEPSLLSGATFGSGFFIPQAMAHSQAATGDLSFRIGVRSALGGAPAALGWSASHPASGGPMNQNVVFRREAMVLAGAGPGQGLGTWVGGIPAVPAMVGQNLYAQWYVRDAGASGHVAKSSIVELLIF